ncbi:MAG: chitobiase/beta-hexosaminidase C-terminal domain-containing protein, partial [Verrucomicrobiales bacterium]
TFAGPVSVSISSATSGTTIRYTLNGANPTASSPIYTAPFTVSATTTVKAKGFKAGMNDSAIATASFTINTPQNQATPVISPNGGTCAGPVRVSISSATSGTTIRYTLNGANPTASSPIYTAPFTVSATTTVKAKGFKAGMNDSAVATAQFTISTGTSSNQAVFAGVDSTTKGSWKGVYGNDGYLLIGDNTKIPAYAKVTYAGKTDHIWQYTSADPRAVQKVSTETRIASTAYSGTSFNVEVTLDPGVVSRVSFYCLDWDRQNRTQTIEVVDGTTGVTIDTRNVESFGEGAYYSWDVSGKVIFRFTRTGPYNAVQSALFFTRN